MAIVSGVNIPDNKRVEVSLTRVFGIGPAQAQDVVEKAGVLGNPRVSELTESDLTRIREVIDREKKVEGDLRRELNSNIRRLIDIGSYRGMPSPARPSGERSENADQRAREAWTQSAGCRQTPNRNQEVTQSRARRSRLPRAFRRRTASRVAEGRDKKGRKCRENHEQDGRSVSRSRWDELMSSRRSITH